MAGKVIALYVYACQRCGQVQDHEPERCCGVVRSSLAVSRPGRALPHLAPPPTGARCPPWIGVSVASRAPSLPGRLATPSAADVAGLALRRCYEGLQSGRPAVSVRDAVVLVRPAHEIEHDAASQGAGNDARWQATLREILWLARRHLGEGWKPFAADLRASGAMNLLWGPPPPRPAARLLPGVERCELVARLLQRYRSHLCSVRRGADGCISMRDDWFASVRHPDTASRGYACPQFGSCGCKRRSQRPAARSST
jgi:hypothetical protein